MRKYKRAMLRGRAKKLRVKASEYVHNEWNRYQLALLGPKKVSINKARGTKPKRLWAFAIKGA